MTIFIDVLKQFIKEHLSAAISEQFNKSRGYGYDHALSTRQKEELTALDTAIVLFPGTGNDKDDAEALVGMITEAKSKIERIRAEHFKAADGETIKCLNTLIFATQNFYKKLYDFSVGIKDKFAKSAEADSRLVSLLNTAYKDTPEHIIYWQACYYFGQEIFHPESLDLRLRDEKESKLAIRLQSLFERIKDEHSLEERKLRALEVLDDLDVDNSTVSQRITSGVAIPGLTFYGFQLTSPGGLFAASAGRLGELSKAAREKIAKLSAPTAASHKRELFVAAGGAGAGGDEEHEHDDGHAHGGAGSLLGAS